MEKKFNAITISLLIILGIRFVVQLILSFTNPVVLLFVALYFFAMVGVGLKRKWGSMIAGLIAVIDIISAAAFTSGASGFGAVVYDLILGFLAYKEYQEFSRI